MDTLTAELNVTSCDGQHTEWQTNVEGCNHETLQHSEFKFTWSCQLWSVVGISELETVIRVRMRWYFLRILIRIALRKLTIAP